MQRRVVSQLDKYRNIREDEVKKVGIRHSKKRIDQLHNRQIYTDAIVADPPVSMMKEEEYHNRGYRPPFKVFD